MVEIKKLKFLWDDQGEPVDPEMFEFDEYNGFDYSQHGQQYEFYMIKDMAFWDAIVVWDTRLEEVVAVRSQVIDIAEATEYMKNYLLTNNEQYGTVLAG